MTKSATRIQDKDTMRKLSVVQSTEDPTKYGVVILNPDGSKIRGPKGEAATISVGTTTTGEPGTSASVTNSGTTSDAVFNFTIPKGAKGDSGTVSVGTTTTGEPGTNASVTNSGTSTDAVLNFTIPRGNTGAQGPSGTIAVGTTTTGNPGTNASVTNSGTSTAATFNFTIPRGDKGATGETGNGIESVTSSKSGKVTTVTMDFTDPNMSDFSFTVSDGNDGEGAGDVLGPNSATDGHLAVFDGATGKLIKDGGAVPVVPTVVDNLTTQSATSTLSANQGYVLKGYVDTINGKISSNASSSNKLMDKNYIDDAINSVTAYYITKNAQGDQFATYAELSAATTFYSGGVVRVPTRNDYTVVLADENHDNATTRYSYQGSQWEYQYTVNETALTQSQLDALNSGITSGKVSTYDGYATTISGKQDALSTQTAYTSKGSATKVPQITTNTLGQVTNITEVNISLPGDATSTTAGLVKLGSDTVQSVSAETVSGNAGRTFAIQKDSNGKMVVNVPYPTRGTAASGGTTLSLVNTGDMYTWNNKQDALSTQTAYTTKGTSTKVATISTNTLGQVTAITETDITYPSQVDDTAYASSWDGVTTTAPSKNAVYDKISSMDTTIGGKQDKATSGSTAPSTTPTYIGQVFIDTTNSKMYVAVGTSSSSDWFEVGSGSGVQISSQANNIFANGAKLWGGTQENYEALGTYYDDTAYLTI